MSGPFLSVVIPAYNEEVRLAKSLPKILSYLDDRKLDAEVLVVDDGSTDDTSAVARNGLGTRKGRVIKNNENSGKGFSVRRGVLEAQGRWVLMTDADLSAPIEEHAKLAAAVRDRDLDMAIGSRGLADSQIEIRQNIIRQTMGKSFNAVIRMVMQLPYHDTQCGFKLMDRKRVRPLFERMAIQGFAFDVELLFLCARFDLRVGEIPVVWRNAPDSQVSIVADPAKMLLDLLRIRWRFRRGLYNPESVTPEGPA